MTANTLNATCYTTATEQALNSSTDRIVVDAMRNNTKIMTKHLCANA